MNKRLSRLRRAKRTRLKIRDLEVTRLTVYKTPRHMYAQVTTSDGAKTLLCASTLDKELRKSIKTTGNVEAAKEVGVLKLFRIYLINSSSSLVVKESNIVLNWLEEAVGAFLGAVTGF